MYTQQSKFVNTQTTIEIIQQTRLLNKMLKKHYVEKQKDILDADCTIIHYTIVHTSIRLHVKHSVITIHQPGTS